MLYGVGLRADMWAREQSLCYLKQYIRARNVGPWIVKMHPSIEERARWALQYLDGMAGDWYPHRNDCAYYYPQRNQDVKTHQG